MPPPFTRSLHASARTSATPQAFMPSSRATRHIRDGASLHAKPVHPCARVREAAAVHAEPARPPRASVTPRVPGGARE